MAIAERMLKQAWDSGTRAMILTPHFNPGRFPVFGEEVERGWHLLQEKAKKIHPEFRLYLGNECKYHSDSCDHMESGTCRSMAGSRYMLVEFGVQESVKKIRRSLYNVSLAGFRPILAHAERYQALRKDYEGIAELIDGGVAIQVNAGSIAGREGWHTARFVRKLLAYEMIHFIGSDAHEDTARTPILSDCAAYIEKKYGEDYVRELMWENPSRIWRDEDLF
ncbi:MAG: hypothetical protein HFI93_06460 [Lachnospiraceae bacterium]|nr:hypothetical protein [Lachnospiraceae bacterium]